MATAKKTTATKAATTTTATKTTAAKTPATKTSATKATPTARGRAQDRALVAGEQKYEVSYIATKTGTTPAQVKEALKAEGHSRVKVTKALAAAKKAK